MAAQLNKRCKRDHVHQALDGGRCRDAAFYPAPLVRAILKGMVLQAEEDHRYNAMDRDTVGTVNKIFAMPMASPAPTAPAAWGIKHRSSCLRWMEAQSLSNTKSLTSKIVIWTSTPGKCCRNIYSGTHYPHQLLHWSEETTVHQIFLDQEKGIQATAIVICRHSQSVL